MCCLLLSALCLLSVCCSRLTGLIWLCPLIMGYTLMSTAAAAAAAAGWLQGFDRAPVLPAAEPHHAGLLLGVDPAGAARGHLPGRVSRGYGSGLSSVRHTHTHAHAYSLTLDPLLYSPCLIGSLNNRPRSFREHLLNYANHDPHHDPRPKHDLILTVTLSKP